MGSLLVFFGYVRRHSSGSSGAWLMDMVRVWLWISGGGVSALGSRTYLAGLGLVGDQVVGHLAHVLDHVLGLHSALLQRPEASCPPGSALLGTKWIGKM